VLSQSDAIIAVGALVAAELYGRLLPVVQLAPEQLELLTDDHVLTVESSPASARVISSPAHGGS